MRVKRAPGNYSGGGGTTIYDSEMFKVILWHFTPEKVTEIQVNGELLSRVRLVGSVPLESDDECVEQLTAKEVGSLMKDNYNRGLRQGRLEKAQEIREALGITGRK